MPNVSWPWRSKKAILVLNYLQLVTIDQLPFAFSFFVPKWRAHKLALTSEEAFDVVTSSCTRVLARRMVQSIIGVQPYAYRTNPDNHKPNWCITTPGSFYPGEIGSIEDTAQSMNTDHDTHAIVPITWSVTDSSCPAGYNEYEGRGPGNIFPSNATVYLEHDNW